MRRFMLCLALGCGGDTSVSSGSGDDDDGDTGELETTGPASVTTTSTSTSTSTSASSSTSTGDPSEDSSSSGPPAACGNGILEEAEECDDASEACRDDCLLACRLLVRTEVSAGEGELLALEDVQPGPDGTAIAVGSLGWPGGDVVTAHVDADGELLELDIYDHDGGSDVGVALSVAADGSRSVVINTAEATHVLHYDADGTLLWADTPAVGDAGGGVAVMPGGGLVVSGTAAVGAPGHYEIWAARYGANGHLWDATWGDVSSEVPSHPHGGPVAVSPLGRVYIAGDRPSVSGTFAVYDPVVVAFGPEGGPAEWVWSEWLESSNLTLLTQDITVDAEGNVAALFFVGHGSGSSSHFQLRVFDPEGRPLRTFDSDVLDLDGGEQAGALVADAAGRLVVFSRRFGIQAGDASGHTLVLGFDADGEIVCDEQIEDRLGLPSGAALDPNGDFLFTGTDFVSASEGYATVARIRGFE